MPESSASGVRDVRAEDVGHALRRRWWVPLGGAIVGLLLAVGLVMAQPTTYDSAAQALVHADAPDDSAAERLAAEELAKSRAATYESLGNSVVVAEEVKQTLGLDASAADLLEQVSVVAAPETTGLEITASAGSPEEAQELASTWRDALSRSAASTSSGDEVELEAAGEPTLPDSPAGISAPLAAAVGTGLGLFIGIVVALASTPRPRRD